MALSETASSSSVPTTRVKQPLLRQTDIRQVVVFRALRLGDMLCAVPALRALRRALPDARITLVGLPWAAQFAERFSRYIDDFVPFPGHPDFPEQEVRIEELEGFYQAMQSRHFDLAIQMHGSGQISNGIVRRFGATHLAGFSLPGTPTLEAEWFVEYPDAGRESVRLLTLIEQLGAPSLDADLEFPVTQADEDELQEFGLSPARLPADYICIHPGASSISKCWPAQCFAEVADELAKRFGVSVVLTGSDKEIELTSAVAARMSAKAINAAAPISVGAMAALMGRARLLVSNDTGVSHIAAGLRLPSVVVFNSADMLRWAPVNDALHRCIRDPDGKQVQAVIESASALLAASQRSIDPKLGPSAVTLPE